MASKNGDKIFTVLAYQISALKNISKIIANDRKDFGFIIPLRSHGISNIMLPTSKIINYHDISMLNPHLFKFYQF